MYWRIARDRSGTRSKLCSITIEEAIRIRDRSMSSSTTPKQPWSRRNRALPRHPNSRQRDANIKRHSTRSRKDKPHSHVIHRVNGNIATNPSIFPCQVCGETFISKSYLNGHTCTPHSFLFKVHHAHVRCPLCQTQCASLPAYHEHFQQKHGQNAYFLCYVCKVKFRTLHALIRHQPFHSKQVTNINHKEKEPMDEQKAASTLSSQLFHCKQCNSWFPTSKSFKDHNREIHTKISKALKAKKQEVHIDEKQAIPELELVGPFKSPEEKEHKNDEIIETKKVQQKVQEKVIVKRYRCKLCKKRFEQRCECMRHVCTAHKGQNTLKPVKQRSILQSLLPFQCKVCKKVCITGAGLAMHRKTHLNQYSSKKPFQCKVCKKRFKKEKGLEIHERSHLKDKPKKCPKCDTIIQECIPPKYLNSGKQPLQCNLCKQTFKKGKGLEIHQRSHFHKDGRQKCPNCDTKKQQPIISPSSLKYKYSRRQPFQCKVCKKAFKKEKGLKVHMRSH